MSKSPTPTLPNLIRAEEVAVSIKRSPKTVYKMAQTGRIPCIRFDSGVLFDPAEINDWIDNHRIAA